MKRYDIEVPVWLALLELIVGIVFGAFWMYSAIQVGRLEFILIGVLIFAVIIILGFYMLITGRYPMGLRAR
jgi:flagellar biosynthesis protein FliQ